MVYNMLFLFGRRSRMVSTILIALLTCRFHGQEAEQPILVSHDVIDGPIGAAHTVEDLKVFANGTVTYTVRAKTIKAFTSTIKSADISRLVELINSPEIRELPNEIAAKTRPADFFWDQNFQIVRSQVPQDVHIEQFYPFLNLNGPAYPQELIAFECKLQDIKASAPKPPQSRGNWCEELRAHHFPESDSHKCSVSELETKIAAGRGWGSARVGASFRSIQAALGKATPSEKFSDVSFVEYRSRGIEISLNRADERVHAIYFYNDQQGNGQFGVFCGQTAKGINWNSKIDDVLNAYGHPSADFIQGQSGRLQFPGIDFRFENGKLVRIGVPGK